MKLLCTIHKDVGVTSQNGVCVWRPDTGGWHLVSSHYPASSAGQSSYVLLTQNKLLCLATIAVNHIRTNSALARKQSYGRHSPQKGIFRQDYRWSTLQLMTDWGCHVSALLQWREACSCLYLWHHFPNKAYRGSPQGSHCGLPTVLIIHFKDIKSHVLFYKTKIFFLQKTRCFFNLNSSCEIAEAVWKDMQANAGHRRTLRRCEGWWGPTSMEPWISGTTDMGSVDTGPSILLTRADL